MKVDAEDDFFAFKKEYGGVHPYKVGDRVVVSLSPVDGGPRRATVRKVYWSGGYAKIDLKFDDDTKPGVYRWGAKRVEPLNAVDVLGEIA